MSSNGGSDSDVDIYGDLLNEPTQEEAYVKLKESKKQLEDEVEILKKKLEELFKENSKLESKCRALGTNISSLFKTASAEIERKDRMILELRKEKDNIIFRRSRQGSIKKNYTTSEENDVGVEENIHSDTSDRHPHGDPQMEDQHTHLELAYENESNAVDENYEPEYQHFNHGFEDEGAVQKYDTVFSKRRKQQAALQIKQDKSDKSEIEHESSESVRAASVSDVKNDSISGSTVTYRDSEQNKQDNMSRQLNPREETKNISPKNKLTNEVKHNLSNVYDSDTTVVEKIKSSRNTTHKSNRRDTLCTEKSYKGSDEDMRRCKHKDKSETSSKDFKSKRKEHDHNIKNTSYEDEASSRRASHSERLDSYRIPMRVHERSVSRALKNLRSNSRSRSRSQPRTVSKYEPTYDDRSSQNRRSMTSSNYSKQKCNNDDETKTTFRTSGNEISERLKPTVTSVLHSKLSEHCDFKRQRKCRIKLVSPGIKEDLNATNNRKSDYLGSKTEENREFQSIANKEILSSSQMQAIDDSVLRETSNDVIKSSDAGLVKTNEISCINSCSVNNNAITKEKTDDQSSSNVNEIIKMSSEKSSVIVDNLDNRSEIDKIKANEKNSICSERKDVGISSDGSDESPHVEISGDNNNENMEHLADSENAKEETDYWVIDEEGEVSDDCDIGKKLVAAESRYSKSEVKETENYSKNENSNQFKSSRKSYDSSQISSRERYRSNSTSKKDESSKSGCQKFDDDRKKSILHKNDNLRERNHNFPPRSCNVKEEKRSCVLRESNSEMKKDNSKKHRLSEKKSQNEIGRETERNTNDRKCNKITSRAQHRDIVHTVSSNRICDVCELKSCKCKTDSVIETKAKDLNNSPEQKFCKRDDSARNDTTLSAFRKTEDLRSNEKTQAAITIGDSSSDDDFQTKVVPVHQNEETNPQNIKQKILENPEKNISSKNIAVFRYEVETSSQNNKQENNLELKHSKENLDKHDDAGNEREINSTTNTTFLNQEENESRAEKVTTVWKNGHSPNLNSETSKSYCRELQCEPSKSSTSSPLEENTRTPSNTTGETTKNVFSTPGVRFSVKRKPRSFRLEDSKVVSVNITPPKSEDSDSVNRIEVIAMEMHKNDNCVLQHAGTSEGNNTDNKLMAQETDKSFRQNRSKTSSSTRRELSIGTDPQFINTKCKTVLNFREKYADVFSNCSQESNDSSDEEFLSSSSSCESDQHSDESWHPGKRRRRKFRKSRPSQNTISKSKRLRT